MIIVRRIHNNCIVTYRGL